MEETTQYIIAITGVIAIIVSLVTAVTSTKNSAFTQLSQVVDSLRIELKEERQHRKELEDRLDAERKEWELEKETLRKELNMWRNYTARLIKQLSEVAPAAKPVEFETEPRIRPMK